MEKISHFFHSTLQKEAFQTKYQEIIQNILNDPDVKEFISVHEEEVTQEVLENSYAKFHEFIKERDARKQGVSVKNPGMEPVLVMNVGYVDVSYRPTQEFMRLRKEKEMQNRVKAMNMPKNIVEATFKNLIITVERQEVVQEVLNVIEGIVSRKEFQQGLYLSGPFGVGKTYLFGAMANELATHGFITTLVHVPSLSFEMKQAIQDGAVKEKLDVLKSAHVLMLDDIGAESNTAWFRDEILGIILQYRMLQELPTFFTSNFTLNELEEHFSQTQRGEYEPLKAKRLMERVRFLAKEVVFNGENRRLS